MMVKRNLRRMKVEERGECLGAEKWRKQVEREIKEKRF